MDIDVSKCEYYVDNYEWYDIAGNKKITKGCCDIYLCDEFDRFNYEKKCNDNPNCYYKQLQQYKDLCARKTADIFELEKEKSDLKYQIRDLIQQVSTKEIYLKLNKRKFNKITVKEFVELTNFQKLALTKAEQKLEKIKEICDKNICIDNNGYCPQIKDILEVLENNKC